MTKLWAIGQRYDWFVSNAAVASSIDGQLWENIDSPFEIFDHGTTICTNSNNELIATSSAGKIAWSADQQTWKTGTVGVDNFAVNGTVHTNRMIAAGRRYYPVEQEGYPAGAEIAQIFDSTTGEPDTWAMIFSSPHNPSGFHNIKYFANVVIDNNVFANVCIAVGEKFDTPMICWSIDLGLHYYELNAHGSFNKPFFDVEYDYSNHVWYFATNEMIAITKTLINPQWTSSSMLDSNTAVYRLKVNSTGQICAITKDSIWYSQNLENWQKFSVPGYQWRSIDWFDNKWIAGAESTLTQYTFFTSIDGVNWIPDNNGIQMVYFTTTI
jgi:hypothetical protein